MKTWLKHALLLGGSFLAFTLISLVVLPVFVRQFATRAIVNANKEVALFLAGSSEEALRDKFKQVVSLRSGGPTILSDAWVVDEPGNVIATTSTEPLPSEWRLKPLPGKVLDAIYFSFHPGRDDDVMVVTRLSDSPARYLVVAKLRGSVADRANVIVQIGKITAGFFIWILLGMWLLVSATLYYYNRVRAAQAAIARREKENEAKRNRILQELNHDLRTPLTSLRLLVDGLQLFGAQYDEKMREQALHDISAELDYLTRLVQFLFTLSDMEQATYRIDFRRVKLRELLREEIALRQSSASRTENGIVWELDLCEEDVELEGDRQLLQRALRNALDNATKYAKAKIRVELTTKQNRSLVRITDDGDGPTEEAAMKFGRRPEKVSGMDPLSPEKSFGLGSAIMVAITELHGGKAILSRGATGRGGCQEMDLPKVTRPILLKRQTGFGLIELIMSCSLLALVGFGMLRLFSYGEKAAKKNEVKGELEAVRTYVRDSIDCAATLPTIATVCSAGTAPVVGNSAKTFVTVLGRGSANLVEAPADVTSPPITFFASRYGLRASCGGQKLLFEVGRMVGPGSADFLPDPLTNQPRGWEDLYKGLPAPCQAQLSGPVTAPATPEHRCITESRIFSVTTGVAAGTTVSCTSPTATLTHCSLVLSPSLLFQCGAKLVANGAVGTACQLAQCPLATVPPATLAALAAGGAQWEALLDCCERN